jgi:hypothetical protein
MRGTPEFEAAVAKELERQRFLMQQGLRQASSSLLLHLLPWSGRCRVGVGVLVGFFGGVLVRYQLQPCACAYGRALQGAGPGGLQCSRGPLQSPSIDIFRRGRQPSWGGRAQW